MSKLITKQPFLSLILTSLSCGLLWRAEIEYHGWANLNWLYYFHFAVPIGFVLFLAWANTLVTCGINKRIGLNIGALILGFVSYYLLQYSSQLYYLNGPSMLMLIGNGSKWQAFLVHYAIFLAIPLLPIGMYTLLKIFQLGINLKHMMLAVLGMFITIPVSLLLLDVLDHKGGTDFIHTIKSGFLIAFWAFSMGLIMIRVHKQQQNTTI